MSNPSNVCTCQSCPGAQCTCGCQGESSRPAAACPCGDACGCGEACTCGAGCECGESSGRGGDCRVAQQAGAGR